ncbi:MAG: hypothetical protein ACJ75J_12975, partial [Cytophagaceae bacterium]
MKNFTYHIVFVLISLFSYRSYADGKGEKACITVTASANSYTLCSGTSTFLGIDTIVGGSGNYSYSWTPAGSLDDATIDAPIATPNATTTYTVTVTDLTLGCSGTDTVRIVVVSTPNVAASATRTNICIGAATQLNATVTGGTTPYNYTWSPTTGFIDPANIQNPRLNGVSTATYTVSVADANNCSKSASVTITVNSLPTVHINPIADTVCSGISVNLTSVGSGGRPAYTYAWTPAAGLNNATISNPTATPAVTTTYTLTLKDRNNCTATDNVTVLVYPLPGVAPTASPSTICNSGSSSLNAGASGSGPFTYSWSPAATLDNPTISNPVATPTVTTTYTVTVTDAKGCVKSSSITVTVNQLPLVAPTAGPSAICFGQSSTLNAHASVGGGGPYTYLWSPAGGLNDPTLATPTANPGVTTTYSVVATDSKGCSSLPKTVTLTINSLPTVTASAASPICNGNSTTLTAIP